MRIILFLSVIALGCLNSCSTTRTFIGSPGGSWFAESAASALVMEAIVAEPQTIEVFVALAEQMEGDVPDFSGFANAYKALAVQTLGNVTALYAEQVEADLLAKAIRSGLALAKMRGLGK
jgi:hypothetical protein